MTVHSDEDIPITKLALDCSNPRHPTQSAQRDIFTWMTKGTGRMGDKLLVLARDIAANGLNPAERIMVTPDPSKPGEYLVIEGNRRVAAVKLICNPSLAPSAEWVDNFRRILKANPNLPKTLRCTVFPSPDDAYHFIELKHLGESGGAGVVPWDAEQKARHSLRLRKQSRHHKAVTLLDYVKEKGSDKEVRTLAETGFPITTLDRLLSDKDFRDFLGLCLSEGGELAFRISPAEAMKPISRVIRDFGSGGKNVRDVINKEMRDKYKDAIAPNDRADHAKILQDCILVNSDSSTGADGGAPAPSPSHNRYQNPSRRRTVVIPGTVISIDAKRYNRQRRVFEELKRIQLRDRSASPDFPNAAVLLLRLFLEMSIDTYIAAKHLTHPSPTGWKDISLTERARSVLHDLQQNGRIDNGGGKVINKALADKHKIANPNSLNDYAHNPDQVVNPTDLVDIWDTYTKYVVALWDALR